MTDEEVTIGLETHVQLNTESKLFCSCPNEHSEDPNTHTCSTCLGHPGSRPTMNEEVLRQALMVGKALDSRFNERTWFARKTYFYPDMAKNFQITQYERPVAEDGKIGLDDKEVGIRRIHIEEDPARMVHEGGDISQADYTLVDYNRAGRPLLEIVTEPDLDSPGEAREYLQELVGILRYLGVYENDSDFVLKSDANISLSSGNRVEVKNITGISEIEKALSYEISRQRQLKRRGREVRQETRSFESSMGVTESLRQKESEEDYGYILEPDLTSQKIPDDRIEEIESEIPELPRQKKKRLQETYGIQKELLESIIKEPSLADDFEKLAGKHEPELTASWLSKEVRKTLNYLENSYQESSLNRDFLDQMLEILEQEQISDRNAEKIIREQAESNLLENRNLREVAEDRNLLKSEQSEVEAAVEKVLREETEAVEDYRTGEEDALNYLVGQVMKETNGGADPKETRVLLQRRLDES